MATSSVHSSSAAGETNAGRSDGAAATSQTFSEALAARNGGSSIRAGGFGREDIPLPPTVPIPTTGGTPTADPYGASLTPNQKIQNYLAALGPTIGDGQKQKLAQIGQDATTLDAFFNKYPRGAPQLDNPPPAVAAAEKRLLGVDAIKKQLVVQSGSDKGLVTRDTVSVFLDNLGDDAQTAMSSWDTFKSSDANPDPASARMAADASLLQAYIPVTDEAGADSKADGVFNAADLHTVATSAGDVGLPASLKQAAALFSSKGMFRNFDNAGNDVATTSYDGLASASNVGSWITSVAPKLTPAMLIQTMIGAANSNMVANVDTSKLGPDVFKNPQNYTGAQKAAVLQTLENVKERLDTGVQENDWNVSYAWVYNLQTEGNVKSDLNAKINQLAQDPSVQKFINAHSGTSLQAIADADSGLKAQMQTYFDGDLQNGTALKAALNAPGVSVQQGLANFMTEATPYALALGSNGKSAKIDLLGAAQKSGEEDKLKTAYQNDILSGNELKNAIAGGTDIGQAVQQFMSDATSFSAVLPPNFIKQNAAKLQNNFSTVLSDSLLGSATPGDLDAAFADQNGNLDTAKLASIVQQIRKQNPDAFKDAAGVTIPTDKIISAFKYVWDTERQFGGKLPDALAKGAIANWKATGEQGPEPAKPTGGVADAYNKGVLHIVSALFGAGVLAAKDREGGGTAAIAVNSVAGSFQVTGALMEGSAKYTKSLPKSGSPSKFIPSASSLKSIESIGKSVGGIGGVIAGAVSIFGGVQALNSGEKTVGGIDIASGATQVLAGGASAAEGVAGLVDASDATLAALGTTSSIFGGVAAGVGVLAFVGLELYQSIEEGDHQYDFATLVGPPLDKYGIGQQSPSQHASWGPSP